MGRGYLVITSWSQRVNTMSCLQGTHPCLQGNTKAMATVTAIIDGTGSMGEDNTLKILLKDLVEPQS